MYVGNHKLKNKTQGFPVTELTHDKYFKNDFQMILYAIEKGAYTGESLKKLLKMLVSCNYQNCLDELLERGVICQADIPVKETHIPAEPICKKHHYHFKLRWNRLPRFSKREK